MRSRATPRFWAAYRALPAEVRDQARRAYSFKKTRVIQVSGFKKIHDRDDVYSVRVTLSYRAVGLRDGEKITWFWIGSHADYDRLVAKL